MRSKKRATPAPSTVTDSQRLDRIIELLDLMCKSAQIRTRPARTWSVADYQKLPRSGLGRAANRPRPDDPESDLLQSGGTDPKTFWSRKEPK